jgi:large subunit ribosomal protein L25
MSKKIAISAKTRTVLGKKVKKIRKEGLLPGAIYMHGKESLHIEISEGDFMQTYKEAGYTQPIEVNLDGDSHLAMIKEVDHEPIKRKLLHVVFQAIDKNKKVEAEVPVTIDEGSSEAERIGLNVLHVTDKVEVSALPHDMPKSLSADVQHLKEVGDRVLANDIDLPEGVELISDSELVIAIVEEVRVTSEADLANDAPEATVEVEAENGGSTTNEAEEAKK